MTAIRNFLLINPNTTELVTQRALEAARSAATGGTRFEGVTGSIGVPIINSHCDNAIGCYSAMELAAKHAEDFDGVLLAVSFDSGLYELREMLSIPVAGFTESAIYDALSLKTRYSLISFAPRTRPLYEALTVKYGLNERLAGVRCMAAPTPAELRQKDFLIDRVSHEVKQAVSNDGADVAVLCATAFAGFAGQIDAEVPVVDGISTAVKELEQYCLNQALQDQTLLANPDFPERKVPTGVSGELKRLYSRFP